MSTPQKEVVYVDVDDEITGLIDKVTGSKSKIVALVLPKRAAVLQSIVNMRLLKRTADDAGRRVVLITSEAGVLPLAGVVGVYAAKTLQSKPVIPPAPALAGVNDTYDAELTDSDLSAVDKTRPVGELAGGPALASAGDDDAIEIDNDDAPVSEATPAVAGTFNKKLRVPNFEKFRLWIILGTTIFLLLVIGWLYAAIVLPKATITIKTDTTSLNSDLNFTANSAVKELDMENLLVPAVVKELKKTDSEKVTATGQKDNGTKAFGQVTLSMPCSSSVPTVPAYTFVSTNNLNFVTQTEAELEPTVVGGSCRFVDTVNVVAQNAGDQYNISSGRTFTVSGYSSITGKNDDPMSGGTTKLVKVVSQQDVDNAKQKLAERTTDTATEELKKQLDAENLIGINETLQATDPVIKSTPKVGDESSEVIVTSETKYTVTGIYKEDLKRIIEDDATKRIDTSKQVVLENGLDDAILKLLEKRPNGQLKLNVQTVVVAGPQLDAESIKKEVAGKKRGETDRLIRSRPGIREVTIDYSPSFLVHSTPKKLQKITVVFEKNDTSTEQ